MKKLLFIIPALFAGTLCAQSLNSADTPVVKSASAASLNDTAAAPQPAADDDRDTGNAYILLRSKGDTVLILKDKDINGFLGRINKKIDKSRKQGYGGGGGWTPGFMAVDISPVRELQQKEPGLKAKNFNLGGTYAAFSGGGGMGYGGIGNGVRIGGGGWSASHHYTSDLYGAAHDSIARLDVEASYGGVLFEKAFVRNNFNYFVGGIIGSGSITVTRNYYRQDEPSAFSTDMSGSSAGSEKAEADFTALELHGGCTYSLVSWFHFGLDAGVMGFISTEGFGGSTSAFNSINGNVRLRLIWGNLG